MWPGFSPPLRAEPDDDAAIARAWLTCSARTPGDLQQPGPHQDPTLGTRVSAARSPAQAVEIYKRTPTDPRASNPASRHGRLLHAQMDASRGHRANQATSTQGRRFRRSFRRLSRLVNEAFESRERRSPGLSDGPRATGAQPQVPPDEWEADGSAAIAPGDCRRQSYARRNGQGSFRVPMTIPNITRPC